MIEVLSDDQTIDKHLPILGTKEYLSINSNIYGWLKSDAYILPYFITVKLGIKRLLFTCHSIKIKENSLETEKMFLNDVISYLKGVGICFVECPPSYAVFDEIPDGSKSVLYGTFQIDLSPDEETLFANLHHKHRLAVKKSIANDVQIVRGKNLLSKSYALYADTLKRQGIRHFSPEKHITELVRKLDENVECFAAIYNNEIQCIAIIPFNDKVAYYYCGGSVKNPKWGSAKYLQWEIIKFCKEKNIAIYDLNGAQLNPAEGTKSFGIQRFKKGFNPHLKKGYLWKIVLDKRKYLIYRCMLFIRNSLMLQRMRVDNIDRVTGSV